MFGTGIVQSVCLYACYFYKRLKSVRIWNIAVESSKRVYGSMQNRILVIETLSILKICTDRPTGSIVASTSFTI